VVQRERAQRQPGAAGVQAADVEQVAQQHLQQAAGLAGVLDQFAVFVRHQRRVGRHVEVTNDRGEGVAHLVIEVLDELFLGPAHGFGFVQQARFLVDEVHHLAEIEPVAPQGSQGRAAHQGDQSGEQRRAGMVRRQARVERCRQQGQRIGERCQRQHEQRGGGPEREGRGAQAQHAGREAAGLLGGYVVEKPDSPITAQYARIGNLPSQVIHRHRFGPALQTQATPAGGHREQQVDHSDQQRRQVGPTVVFT
jgi:hypothetical protein